MMMHQTVNSDVVVVGGGLAGCLTAYYLKTLRPNRKIVLIEKRDALGGNHTWTFRKSEIPENAFSWIAPLVSSSWDSYDVLFPNQQRKLSDTVCSIRSEDLHQNLTSALGSDIWLSCDVKSVASDCIITNDRYRFDTPLVIDARGYTSPATPVPLGYRKFLGLDVELQVPHGLRNPLLLDAICAQKDGFRYISLFPWSEFSILIEDTRFSNFPEMDLDSLTKDVLMYAQTRGWQVDKIKRAEKGIIPLPMFLFPSQIGPLGPSAAVPVGMAARYFHYSTGNSVSFAIQVAEMIGQLGRWTSGMASAALKKFDDEFFQKQKYFAMINRMLFLGAKAEDRYKIFETLYKQSPELITAFYSNQLTATQKMKLFAGKPPLPIHRAIKSYFKTNHSS